MSNSNCFDDKNIRRSIGGGLVTGMVFVVLRVVNVIDWSWWAVTAPLWGVVTHQILALVPRVLLKGREYGTVEAFVGLSGVVNVFVVFAVLKVLGVIDWRWGVVSIPLWVGVGLMLLTGFGFAMKRRFDDKKANDTDTAA